jgi:NAD(P) transhydrogenase subunit alpha
MTQEGVVAPHFEDEVLAASCLTHDGVVRHEPTAQALHLLALENAPATNMAAPNEGVS